MKKALTTLLTTALLTTPLFAAEKNNGIKGVWQTQKQDDENRTAHVEIYDCGEQLCGKIIALEEPIDPETGKPKLDKKNPDEKLRTRPVIGLKMLEGFEMEDENTYAEGIIYSPRTGKTYESKLHLREDDILEVTGYIFIFHKTQEWTRVKLKSKL